MAKTSVYLASAKVDPAQVPTARPRLNVPQAAALVTCVYAAKRPAHVVCVLMGWLPPAKKRRRRVESAVAETSVYLASAKMDPAPRRHQVPPALSIMNVVHIDALLVCVLAVRLLPSIAHMIPSHVPGVAR